MSNLKFGGLGELHAKNGGLGKVKSTPLKFFIYITLYLFGGLGEGKIRNIKKVIENKKIGYVHHDYIKLTWK